MNSILSTTVRYSRFFVIAADCASIALAQIMAYLFRFEFVIPQQEKINLLYGTLLLIPFKVALLYWFGLYRGMWRYTGTRDLQNLLKANVTATALILLSLLLINNFHGLSRSVFLMDGVLCFLLTSGLRVLIRAYFSYKNAGDFLSDLNIFSFKHNRKGVPTLILGAGAAGEALIREVNSNNNLDISLVGLMDDAPNKQGRSIHGVPVLATIDQIEAITDKFNVQQIIIAMPSASADQMRRAVQYCDSTGLTYKTLPGMGALIEGSVSIKDLREVNYEDLLGRPQVQLDDQAIGDYLQDNSVLITGAGGSIGSELCRQILKYRPKHLTILDNSEINLFNIDVELKASPIAPQVTSWLGRIQDGAFLDKIFTECAPKVVFHAAAYKHVHFVEQSPWEGVLNNVIGSKVLMETACRHRIERFVVVSTDKAVRPTNVMGACKRVTELLTRCFDGFETKFMSVRFGNVVGSSGSVVPFFQEQIRRGGPVTVTHPDATRYFMSIPEASKLVLQAGAMGQGGEIFILEMGTPVKIIKMAEDLIRLSGKEPYKDIDIIITSLRTGEKVYEELISIDEEILSTKHDKILVLGPTNHNGDEPAKGQLKKELDDTINKLLAAAATCDAKTIKAVLHEIVPEYAPR